MNRSFLVPVLTSIMWVLTKLSLHSQGRNLVCGVLGFKAKRRGKTFECQPYEPRIWNELYVVAFCIFSATNLFMLAPKVRESAGDLTWMGGIFLVVIPIYRIVEILKTAGSVIFVDRELQFESEIGNDIGSYYTLIGNLNSWLIMIFVKWIDMLYCFATLVFWQSEKWKPVIDKPLDALYATVVTMVTLGYGDYVPTCETTRTIVIAQLLCFVIYFLLVFPVVAASFRTHEIRR